MSTAARGQIVSHAPLKLTIAQRQQFAHPLQLPSVFRKSNQDAGTPSFDHYTFRLAASSPDVLLLGACRYENPSKRAEVEVCSASSFAIDTSGSYTVKEAKNSDWNQASPIDGFFEMDDPVHRTLKQEIAKPAAVRAIPIGREADREGYTFDGKSYIRRSKWISALNFGASAD